jgi:cytidine deaminase
MIKHQLHTSFEEYDTIDSLTIADRELMQAAIDATNLSYSPYSLFRVGAAARLENGAILKGSNQENASYPVSICAERVLLSVCASLYPKVPILEMAISYRNENGKSDKPICPCGMCRQALLESELIGKHSIRLIMGGLEGKVIVMEKAHDLLPLAFTSDDLLGTND